MASVMGLQLEDVLSWRCGHPQMRGSVPAMAKDGDTDMPDLQLDALASLDRHASRYSAFCDEEDEDELHSLYLVRPSLPAIDYQWGSIAKSAGQCKRQEGKKDCLLV